jgi:hypothetical protein
MLHPAPERHCQLDNPFEHFVSIRRLPAMFSVYLLSLMVSNTDNFGRIEERRAQRPKACEKDDFCSYGLGMDSGNYRL